MSIPGLRSGGVPAAYLPESRTQERTAGAPPASPQPSQPQSLPAIPGAGAGPGGLLSAEPPAGTDPSLWSVLSPAERAYYARARAQGPLTYTPGATPSSAPTARGGRLDVKA